MKQNHRPTHKRRGFTIVELVIVIAVIGILATVLVPTFGDIITKANQAKDIQTAKNMNTALAVYGATMSEEPVGNALIQDIDDVMDALAQAGFDTAKELTPVCKGHSFYWYKTINQIVYVNEQKNDFELVYPKGIADFPASKDTTLTNIADEAPDASDTPNQPDTPDQPKDDDSYAGKTVSILGDSISTFSGVPNVLNYVYPNISVKTQTDTWWQQVIDTLGMELLVNNASGGSRALSDEYFNGTGIRNGNHAAYRDRCINLHNGSKKPDVILVFMGTNDFSYHVDPDCAKCQALLTCAECSGRADKNVNVCTACRAASGVYSSFCDQPLGTAAGVDLSNAENPTSTCEAYAIMLHKMKQAYPDAEIYCMSLLPRMDPYDANKAKPYHDHGQPTAFNAELKKVAENAGATFVNLEACVDNALATWSTYFGDSVHPNAAGMDMISQAVIDAMLGKDAAHAITWDLTGMAANVTTDLVLNGTALNSTLTANSGYKVSSVKVTMGGKDITSSAYADGKLTIPSITGNVTVTASAEIDTVHGIIWSVMAIDSNTGKDANNGWTKRISTNFINAVNGATVSVIGDNTEFCVFYYDSSMKFLGWNNAYTTTALTVSPSNCTYIRVMARNKSNTNATLTADYGSNIKLTF